MMLGILYGLGVSTFVLLILLVDTIKMYNTKTEDMSKLLGEYNELSMKLFDSNTKLFAEQLKNVGKR